MRYQTYRTRARLLKDFGLIEFDLRKKLTPAQKATVTKLHAQVSQFSDKSRFAAIKVPKSTKTGDRYRVKNTVFVSRDNFTHIRFERKTGDIVKSRRDGKVTKRMRDPIAPRPGDIDKRAAKLKKGQYLMIRTADASGAAGAGRRYDAQQWKIYKQQFRARYLFGSSDPTDTRHKKGAISRLIDQGYTRKEAEKLAREEAREIIEGWYVAEYTEER